MMSVIALFEFILEAMLYLCIFASIENELFSLFSNYCVDPWVTKRVAARWGGVEGGH